MGILKKIKENPLYRLLTEPDTDFVDVEIEGKENENTEFNNWTEANKQSLDDLKKKLDKLERDTKPEIPEKTKKQNKKSQQPIISTINIPSENEMKKERTVNEKDRNSSDEGRGRD